MHLLSKPDRVFLRFLRYGLCIILAFVFFPSCVENYGPDFMFSIPDDIGNFMFGCSGILFFLYVDLTDCFIRLIHKNKTKLEKE